MRKEVKAIKAVTKYQFLVNMEINQLITERINRILKFTERHTLYLMRTLHNCLGRDHYAHCAVRPKLPELWAELSKECCPNSPGRIHLEPISPVSALTAHFDPM